MAVSLPFTFTNGTVADAIQVNANFSALATAVDGGGLGSTGGTISNPSQTPGQGNSLLTIQSAGAVGPGPAWTWPTINFVAATSPSGANYSWAVGGTPAGHFEVRNNTLGSTPLSIFGGTSGNPQAGNVFINQGGLLIGNPGENINLQPGPGTLTVNENTGTTLPPYPAGGTTAVRIIGEDGQAVRALFDCFGGGAPNFLFRHANGTAASMTPLPNGYNVGVLAFVGCSQAGAFDALPAGWINCKTTENWGPGAGCRFEFSLVANGQPSSSFRGVAVFDHDGACLNASGTWGTLSDPRVKTIQGPYQSGLEAVLTLNPIEFQYNGKADLAPNDHVTRYGLDAESVRDVMPEMVHSMRGKIDETETDILTIDSGPLIYTLVNAVKELARKVEALEK